MTQKALGVGLLNDYYGSLLTQYQSEIISMYYDEDLSLAEIGQKLNISRQAVHDVIKNAEQKLNEYEQKLGLVNKIQSIKKDLEASLSIVPDTHPELKGMLLQILDEVKKI